MRPAAWPALILAGFLCMTCPALPAALLAVVSWVLFTPLAAATALAVTLIWIAVRPESERRVAR